MMKLKLYWCFEIFKEKYHGLGSSQYFLFKCSNILFCKLFQIFIKLIWKLGTFQYIHKQAEGHFLPITNGYKLLLSLLTKNFVDISHMQEEKSECLNNFHKTYFYRLNEKGTRFGSSSQLLCVYTLVHKLTKTAKRKK